MTKDIPTKIEAYRDVLGSYDEQLYDGTTGEPTYRGWMITQHLGDRFAELNKLVPIKCASMGNWFVVDIDNSPGITPESKAYWTNQD